MHEIETGIPIPAARGNDANNADGKYGFGRLEVGQSLFFPGRDVGKKARSAANSYAHSRGLKFTARSMDGGVRVWRTA